jgi:cobaltochelatase CobN
MESGVDAAYAIQALEHRLSSIDIAAKNQDNREHDIFDSDDYFQEHGGLIAAIRMLRGTAPKSYFGDSSVPEQPRVRDLAQEAARVVRTRVVNPKWINAMMAHGYKGAFEMAATVDYMFGYDATAGVIDDWMYDKLVESYVADKEVREFFKTSNPWALASIVNRLLEAARREMWNPSDEALEALRAGLLEVEGWAEG